MRRFKSKPSSEANQSSATKSQQTNTSSSSKTNNGANDGDQLSDDNEDTLKQQRLLTECNICLDIAKDAVVSMCGHLFCWPCLHQWLHSGDSNSQSQRTCPVCKSAISKEKVIPIYGRDQSNRQDPRDKLPPRPTGQWTEVPNNQNQFPYGNVWAMGGSGAHIFNLGDGGFHMTFGFGSLPQYVLAFLQEYTTNERGNETDFFFMKFFAICGFLCMGLTLYFC